MKYIELKIHASRQGVEMVTEMLLRNGIASISVDDPADLQDILDKKNEYGWDYIDDAVKRHADREPVVKVYLEDSEEGQAQLQHLKIEVMKLKSLELEGKFGWDVDFGRLYAEAEVVDDADWKDKWKEHFKPARITDRIVVCPSWEAYTPKAGELVIDIDPGMAFGTGTHETTRLCMALMQLYLQRMQAGRSGDAEEPSAGAPAASDEPGALNTREADAAGVSLAGKTSTAEAPAASGAPATVRVLDVGCGSGILSIGARLLGAGQVLGVEIDPDAVEVARENVAKNGMGSGRKDGQNDDSDGSQSDSLDGDLNYGSNGGPNAGIEIRQGDLTEGLDFEADIIVANLMADLVMRLAGSCRDHLAEGGVFISSGILLEKKELVAAAIREAGFAIEQIVTDGEWCAIAARSI